MQHLHISDHLWEAFPSPKTPEIPDERMDYLVAAVTFSLMSDLRGREERVSAGSDVGAEELPSGFARPHGMEELTVDLPHKLDPIELRRRMEEGVAKLPSYIPGGVAQVRHSWPTKSRMALEVKTFGQVIPAHVDLMLGRLRVTVGLPRMLKLMASPIEAMVRRSGKQLLLEKPAKGSED